MTHYHMLLNAMLCQSDAVSRLAVQLQCTHPKSALPHELIDKLGMAVRREPEATSPTTSTGTKTTVHLSMGTH